MRRSRTQASAQLNHFTPAPSAVAFTRHKPRQPHRHVGQRKSQSPLGNSPPSCVGQGTGPAPTPRGESSRLSMGGGGGVSICRLLAGVRLRRRDEGVGWAPEASRPPKARPVLAGVRPRPENVRKSPGAGPFCPSVAFVVGVKSRLTPSPAGTRAGVAMLRTDNRAAERGGGWAAAGAAVRGRLRPCRSRFTTRWSDVTRRNHWRPVEVRTAAAFGQTRVATGCRQSHLCKLIVCASVWAI